MTTQTKRPKFKHEMYKTISNRRTAQTHTVHSHEYKKNGGASDGSYRLSVTHEYKSHIIELDFTMLRTIMNTRTLHQIHDDTHGDTHVASAIHTWHRRYVQQSGIDHIEEIHDNTPS